jgi:hypothetical protein
MELLSSAYDRSKYLRAEDLERDRKFRIKAVTEEVFEKDGKREKKPVLWFTNDDRGLVLNKTTNRTIRGAFGDPFAGWIRKIIVVFPTMVDLRGKMTPALRVRIPPPKAAAPQQPTAPQQPPVTSGDGANGATPPAAVPLAAAAVVAAAALTAPTADPELEPDPVKPIGEDLDDEIAF